MRAEVLRDQNITDSASQQAELSTKPPVRVLLYSPVHVESHITYDNRDESLCRCIGPGGSLLWVHRLDWRSHGSGNTFRGCT